MDDSPFARSGRDPDWIGPSRNPQAEAADPPQPVPAKAGREVAARSADGGGSPPGEAFAGSPLHHPADGPPPGPGEDFEHDDADFDRVLNAWLHDNRETMRALARAGQLPDLEPPRFSPPAEPEMDGEPDPFAFDPVPIRARVDGWTAERQVAFIEALAECACVVEACRAVKMSKRSAYMLRARPEAVSFRNAWDTALDYATRCLADAVLSRAVNGVVNPVFFQGEQVGERRTYDERLAIFLLQRRDPLRFGPWRDKAKWSGHPEGQALELLKAKAAVREDAELAPQALAERVFQRLASIADALVGTPQGEEPQAGENRA